ncbi:type II toxin-antitoxin system VapC family toxin [Acidianus brierleyi]|uniref:type II toxin-antitoxin system VapC family toxin n=1 Tax=Acidianus brierleyi TaxID=41673 RepID=UPI00248462C0|nr:type II toxin-antitoxin system VapC family toxin [Acidianus brierleyi]
MFLDANFLIYLNLGVKEIEEVYLKLLREESLALDPLVLDEVIYVSRKKYNVKFKDTIEFLDEIVLQNSILFSITSNEYKRAKDFMINYSLKPSDSLHVAVMLNNSIKKILTEDKDFDKIK